VSDIGGVIQTGENRITRR